MKTVKPKQFCHAILICVFVLNVLTHTLVHAARTIPGVKRLEEGIAAYEHGEYDDAVFKLEMAVYQIPDEEKGDLWDAHFYLGLSYYLAGENDEAKKEFSKAQEIIKNRLPDSDIHSPKVVRLFKDALEPGQDDEWKDPITGMAFVFVKGGCYEMGDTFGDGEDDEEPVHEVCVDDFYMGKYEVTQGQWEEVMSRNPSSFKYGNNYPVTRVSWNDVKEFIKKLNSKTGKNYRLPTEAEWEYAARSGGKKVKWSGTSSSLELGNYAWYNGNSSSSMHPVGQKKPNGLGLYDMSGNVFEWCQDIHSGNAYSKHQQNNPIYNTGSDTYRVLRGGIWDSGPWDVRTFCRSAGASYHRGYYYGFRLARTVD